MKNDTTMAMLVFRIKLSRLMKSLEKNQAQFAKQIGITPAALNQLIKGKRNPSIGTYINLVRATGVNYDYFFTHKKGYR